MSFTKQSPLLSAGAFLVAPDTPLPPDWRLANASDATGWSRLANSLTGHQLEKELATTGWTFFFMAGPIATIAFGLSRPGMLDAALARLIAAVTLRKCNCLEIDSIEMRSFLRIPYVRISAHPRHIQKGVVFSSH